MLAALATADHPSLSPASLTTLPPHRHMSLKCPNEKQKDPSHKKGGPDLDFAAGKTQRLVKRFACAAVLCGVFRRKKLAW
jgi:hypothetical protein